MAGSVRNWVGSDAFVVHPSRTLRENFRQNPVESCRIMEDPVSETLNGIRSQGNFRNAYGSDLFRTAVHDLGVRRLRRGPSHTLLQNRTVLHKSLVDSQAFYWELSIHPSFPASVRRGVFNEKIDVCWVFERDGTFVPIFDTLILQRNHSIRGKTYCSCQAHEKWQDVRKEQRSVQGGGRLAFQSQWINQRDPLSDFWLGDLDHLSPT